MNKKNIMWNTIYAGIAVVTGIVCGYAAYNMIKSDVTKKGQKVVTCEKKLTTKQSLALDLLKEFEDDMNGKYKEEGIEMSIVYNDKEYTKVSDFEEDVLNK